MDIISKKRSTENLVDKILLSKWFYFLITAFFLVFSAYVFSWGRIFEWRNKDYVADNNLLSTYGDFVGGVLGTIFAMLGTLLVVKTFIDQRKSSNTQIFNQMFYELFHLYQNQVGELCGQAERVRIIKEKNSVKKETASISYNNKDYFDTEKAIILANSSSYMKFYIQNRSKIDAYYRTLFNIYRLIDESALIDESQKKVYSKIVRAQLTESELYFLRYNAQSTYGIPFQEYLNKYHILKHLPVFDQLKIESLKGLDLQERESINLIYFRLTNALKDNYGKYGELIPISTSSDKYKIEVCASSKSEFTIYCQIDNSKESSDECVGLDKLHINDIEKLLKNFIDELFIKSNFGSFNKKEELKTLPISSRKKDLTTISCTVNNVKGKRLIFRYDDYQKYSHFPYNILT